jgi:Uma2 family endonuclease
MATTHVPMTAEQFDALPVAEEGPRYELLDGELIEVSSASGRHNYIAGLLAAFINIFLLRNPIAAVLPETEFALGESRLQPDIAVLSRANFERMGEGRSPVRELPAIVVEIASPSESAIKMEGKITSYLGAGVSEVWVIYPDTQHLFVHTTSGAKLFDRNAVLETPLLPGWSLRVSEIFRD